jgi:hypothetical protein
MGLTPPGGILTRGEDRDPKRSTTEPALSRPRPDNNLTVDSAPEAASPRRRVLVVRSQGVEIVSIRFDRRRARVDLGLGGPPGEPGLPLPALPLRRALALASLLARRGWTLDLDRHGRPLFTLGREAPAWAGHLGPHVRGMAEWLRP